MLLPSPTEGIFFSDTPTPLKISIKLHTSMFLQHFQPHPMELPIPSVRDWVGRGGGGMDIFWNYVILRPITKTMRYPRMQTGFLELYSQKIVCFLELRT